MAEVANGGKRLSLDKRAMTRRTSLALPTELPLEAWVDVGHQIAVLADASAWWLGDWLVYGQNAFPDRYQRAVERTGLSYKTLRNYAWIAGRFPASRRRDTLTLQHHAEVASLSDEEQDAWLDRAEREQWSVHRLRNHLRAEVRNGRRRRGASTIVLEMQIAPERQQRWEKAAERAGKDLIYWASQVLDHAAHSTSQPAETSD